MAAWVPIADVPGGGGDTWQVCSHGGKVYLASGWTNDFSGGYPNVLEYDPVADTYTDKAALPDPATYGCSAYWAGIFYLLSGDGATTVSAYDIAADVVRSSTLGDLDPLPYACDDGVAVGVGGKIIVVGGSDSGLHGHVQILDTATGHWTVGTDWPGTTAGWIGYGAIATDGTDVFILAGYSNPAGGGGGGSDMADIWKYTVATDTWTHVDDLPYPVEAPAFMVVGTKAYLVSGQPTSGYLPGVIVWDMVSHAHQHDTDYPAPNWGSQGAAVGSDIFVFGGYNGTELASAYKLATDPQADYPTSPIPPETPGDAFARPLMLDSITGSGSVTATTAGATWEGAVDPFIDGSLFGSARTINLQFPSPMPPGSRLHVSVHGSFTASWGIYLERRNIPDTGTYSGTSSGLHAAGDTVVIDVTAPTDVAHTWMLVVESNEEASFTVDYSWHAPQPTPTVEGSYAVAVPERRNLRPWPRVLTVFEETGAPYRGGVNTHDAFFRLSDSDALILTTEIYTATYSVATLGWRIAHVTPTALTVGAATLLDAPADPTSGAHTEVVNSISVAAGTTRGIFLRERRHDAVSDFSVCGFDVATQSFGFAVLPSSVAGTGGWKMLSAAAMLSSTKGVVMALDGIYVIDLAGVTPSYTMTDWRTLFSIPSGTGFGIDPVAVLPLTSTTFLFMYRTGAAVGAGPNTVAVVTVAGTALTLGPETATDIIDMIPSVDTSPSTGATYTCFSNSGAESEYLVARGAYPFVYESARFSVAGGVVTVSYPGTPTDVGTITDDSEADFGLATPPVYTGTGQGWVCVRMLSGMMLVPVARASQSGISYGTASPQNPDISIDLASCVPVNHHTARGEGIDLDPGAPIAIGSGSFGVEGTGAVILNGMWVTAGPSGPVIAIKVPGDAWPPTPAQDAHLVAYKDAGVVAAGSFSGMHASLRTTLLTVTGTPDTRYSICEDDQLTIDQGERWQTLSGTIEDVGAADPWRAADYDSGYVRLSDEILQAHGTATATSSGAYLRPGWYTCAPGDTVRMSAHCLALGPFSGDVDDPAGTAQYVPLEARAFGIFWNRDGVHSRDDGPWVPVQGLYRPIRHVATAPAGTTMFGVGFELRRADAAAFGAGRMIFTISRPDFYLGAPASTVDIGDAGIDGTDTTVMLAGISDPGGPTILKKQGTIPLAGTATADHQSVLVDDDGTVWAVAALGSPTYGYVMRHYSAAGTLLGEYASPKGMPVQIAPTPEYLYYTVGGGELWGLYFASGTHAKIMSLYDTFSTFGFDSYVAGVIVLTGPTGPAPSPAFSGTTELPDGLELIVQGTDGSLMSFTTSGLTFLHSLGDGGVPGTLRRETDRSLVVLARNIDVDGDQSITRLWTDTINWHADPLVKIVTPNGEAAVGVAPARGVRGKSNFRGLTALASKARRVVTGGVVRAGELSHNRTVTSRSTVTFAWHSVGLVYPGSSTPTPILIDGPLQSVTAKVGVAPTEDLVIDVYRGTGTTLIGTITIPAGATEAAITPSGATWASESFAFTVRPNLIGTEPGLSGASDLSFYLVLERG